MNYPFEILPNKKYKLISCDISNHYLIRFTKSKLREEILDAATNQIKQTQIVDPSKGMEDLSTSLLGIFKPSFITLELTTIGKEKYNEYCGPDIEIDPPIFNVDYLQNDSRGFWVVLIRDIDKTVADYTKGGISTKFKATCVIQHTPMKWNYWHFSIRWDTPDGFWHELSESQKRKLTKRLGHEARANIAKFAKIELPEYPILETKNYFKESIINLGETSFIPKILVNLFVKTWNYIISFFKSNGN